MSRHSSPCPAYMTHLFNHVFCHWSMGYLIILMQVADPPVRMEDLAVMHFSVVTTKHAYILQLVH